jgi:hypothetical protein
MYQTQTTMSTTVRPREWMQCTLADFSEIAPLGKGAFGKVRSPTNAPHRPPMPNIKAST